MVTGCAVDIPTRPLASNAEKILAKNPLNNDFKQYLIKHGYAEEHLPLISWGVDELTLCALFYHTKLDVAKQQLALARLAVKTAGVKKIPTINADIARSDQKNGDINPWAYGLSVDIPIATNDKRQFNIDKATKNVEASRLDVAEIAWQLRNQIATDLIAFHQNRAETELIQQEFDTHNHIARILAKRVDAGIASRTALNNVRLLSLKTKHSLNKKLAQSKQLKAKLAADVGLTPERFSNIKIKPLSLTATLAKQAALLEVPLESKALQEQALLNRIDIRRSIAKYAAAEAEIKLQAAKQIPDITLSPGFLFEFGDKIWSLGFSSLLSLLHPNTALTEEAKQLQAIEGAQFEHLQASIIADISQAHVRYQTDKQNIDQAEAALAEQSKLEINMQKQFDSGLIDRLVLTEHTLNTLTAKQQLLVSQFALLKTTNQIENIMQKPLYTQFELPSSDAVRLN